MSAKKSKALAMKLIDDLLGKEDETGKSQKLKNANDGAKELPADAEVSERIDLSDDATRETEHDDTARMDPAAAPPTRDRSASKKSEEQVRSGVGRYSPRSGPLTAGSTEALLTQSENLRIAQQRILELEQEIHRLRGENEQLAGAGETMRRKADEALSRADSATNKYENFRKTSEEERDLLAKSLDAKSKELERTRGKIEEMESRLSTNLQKIRVRERELENRLELVKMESTALLRSKDEVILDLKRQIDQMNIELDNFRSKGQELNRQLGDKQELLRRTVKALRIALGMLEGDAEEDPQKKAK